MLSEIPAGLAEDVVRGKVRLAGGGSLLPGLASRIETVAGIGTVLVEDPLRCVIRGAAEMLERKDAGKDNSKNATPGLRQLERSFLPNGPGCVRSVQWPPTMAGGRERLGVLQHAMLLTVISIHGIDVPVTASPSAGTRPLTTAGRS